MDHLISALKGLERFVGVAIKASDVASLRKCLVEDDPAARERLLKLEDLGFYSLRTMADAIPAPSNWGPGDRRFIGLALARAKPSGSVTKSKWTSEPGRRLLAMCLNRHLKAEKAGEDFTGILGAMVSEAGFSELFWRQLVADRVEPLVDGARLTSAGRYLASLSPAHLAEVMPMLRFKDSDGMFIGTLAAGDPQRLAATIDELLRDGRADELPAAGWTVALDKEPVLFESRAVSALVKLKDGETKALLARGVERHFPGKYPGEVAAAGTDIGATLGGPEQAAAARWLIEVLGDRAVPAITSYIATWNLHNPMIQDWKVEVLQASAKLLGAKLKPAFVAAMQPDMPLLRTGALALWAEFHEPADADDILRHFTRELAGTDAKPLAGFVAAAGAAPWLVARLAPHLAELLGHKSKLVRDAAAQTLSRMGDESLKHLESALAARKTDTRLAAVKVLGNVRTPSAHERLKAALQSESADDVRDQINKALAAAAPTVAANTGTPVAKAAPAGDASTVARSALDAAIARTAPKLKGLPVTWLKEAALPALHFQDGSVLGPDGVRYLIHRQSREKEMTADTEAAALYRALDRQRSGDFALAVLQAYLGSSLDAKDRWALAVAGLLGDDRIVPVLSRAIRDWAEAARGKLAEYAVQALALLASDAALLAVDAMAIRYRTKFKNIGKAATTAFAAAAASRGLSPAELGDRVLPWLGFEPGKARVLEFGDQRIEVAIGADFKLVWRDRVKGKALKSLPAGAPEPLKSEMKELSAGLKEAAKAQVLRLESLMVQQHRWPAARWAELFLIHPLVFPFATRLVWAAYDAGGKRGVTFRALGDRTLTDGDDEPVPVPGAGLIGVVHPLELTAEERQQWVRHLADYDVAPPFAQLERPVVTVRPGQEELRMSGEFRGIELNAMTFKGRAERLGWSRGSVIDAGGINSYFKPFPTAGVDVFVGLDGMYIGIDMYSDITLGDVVFVKHGSVQVGSYQYDEVSNAQDGRVVPFGEVPQIAFSEAMGDLARISGRSAAANAEETEE